MARRSSIACLTFFFQAEGNFVSVSQYTHLQRKLGGFTAKLKNNYTHRKIKGRLESRPLRLIHTMYYLLWEMVAPFGELY